MKLRPYQSNLLVAINRVWTQGGTPLAVLPTGAGKTVVFARALHDHDGPAVAIAHRRELVGQMSIALAREDVTHRIISPDSTIRAIVRNNAEQLGKSCYSPNADVAVAGVDSIKGADDGWCRSVTKWVMDEGHHVLRDNKWGRAIDRFPNAQGLGVTATPGRADGKGLGLHAEGVFTEIVEGPTMRELIDAGFLCDYRVVAPPSTVDLSDVKISSATGDYSPIQLRNAVSKAKITGDVVSHYIKHANGKLGVTFAVDVAAAREIADAFVAAGVPALAVWAKTPPAERSDAIRRFANREILQLVNVDLFGEGFDLPAIEVVSFVRPTQSFPLYAQSFGRALRIMDGKTHAVIIDHVENIVRHKLPDRDRVHSLDSRERRKSSSDPFGLRPCPECVRVYERFHVRCPYCGHMPQPALRSAPEYVDGDLVELDAETLARMRQAEEHVNMDPTEYEQELIRRHCPVQGLRRNVRIHEAAQLAQTDLRHAMDWWRGVRDSEGYSERESFKLFYLSFGVDVLTARALGRQDADELRERIHSTLPFAAQCMS